MDSVDYRKDGHIAYIGLNDTNNLNAINRTMAKELTIVWKDYRDDKDLWVAILYGHGKSFCAGANVKEMERGKWNFRQSLVYGDDRFLPSQHGVYKPIIGAAQRHVFGAGLMLLLECDVRIVADNVKIGLPEGKVNVPFLAAPFVFEYIPRAIAMEMVLTGEPIDAKKAYEIAIVNEIVPEDNLMRAAEKKAEMIFKCGPLANWAAKELSLRCRDMDSSSALALVEHIVTPIWNSEDSTEAKKAFIEKRKPVWKVK